MPLIEVHDLSRRFGERYAVDGLSFTVAAGEVFGVLGHNGAGKTTTVRLLNGLLAPTRGSMRVDGRDPVTEPEAVRRRTGVLTEAPSLYEGLSAADNLRFFAEVYGVPAREVERQVRRALEEVGLADRATEPCGRYSKGMKQRLALARALVHNPPLLFLDEPTAGLDPEATQRVMALIEGLSRQEGRTVVLCTHQLPEAQHLCDRVAIFAHGRVLAEGTIAELGTRLWGGGWLRLELAAPMPAALMTGLAADRRVRQVEGEGLAWRLQLHERSSTPELVAELVGGGARLMRVQPDEPTLEAIYFAMQAQEGA